MKNKIIPLLISLLIVGFGIVAALLRQRSQQPACVKLGQNHRLNIAHDNFSASLLVVNRCDTITIADTGSEDYDFAFGPYNHHINYSGFTMQTLRPNEYFVLDAVQSGSYNFHDHLRDQAHIQLVVK